jgi:hypothetical protein
MTARAELVEVLREPSVADIPDSALLRRVMMFAVRYHKGRVPFWSTVGEITSLGSGYSTQLCRRFGLDPHAVTKKEVRASREQSRTRTHGPALLAQMEGEENEQGQQ